MCISCDADTVTYNGKECTNCVIDKTMATNDVTSIFPTRCTECAPGFHPNSDGSFCEYDEIENCNSQSAGDYDYEDYDGRLLASITGLLGSECEECEEGSFYDEDRRKCIECDIGKCSQCAVAEMLGSDMIYSTCVECEEDYALTREYKKGNREMPRLVCDWSLRRRDLHCLVSDLEDESGCAQCDNHHYFDHLEKKCSLCLTKIEGCASCHHSGDVCSTCQPGFELYEETCKQTECQSHQIQRNTEGQELDC
jgi:hypothetical protein